LNTSKATTRVSKDNLLQAALGAFGQTGKTATAMYSQASKQIESLVNAYAASARMNATEFLAQLDIMSTSVDPKLKQMADTILKLNTQMNAAQQSLIKAIAKGGNYLNVPFKVLIKYNCKPEFKKSRHGEAVSKAIFFSSPYF
jgi:hypothetical protein